MRPSPDELFGEMAELADRFHWPPDALLDLEHRDRRRFLTEARSLVATGFGGAGDE
jgi:hypothetical protein